jgi:inner membrane protease ATP23
MAGQIPVAQDAPLFPAAPADKQEQQEQQGQQEQEHQLPAGESQTIEELRAGIAKCEDMLEKALDTSVVKTLRDGMDKLGCSTTATDFFSCKAAMDGPALIGAFDAGDPKVVLFSNVIDKNMIRQPHVTQTVAHELVHAYDHCRVDIDWRNCFHIACSEVRAARLSGDCDMMTEFARGNFAISGQGKRCARRRAELSVATHAHCKDVVSNE